MSTGILQPDGTRCYTGETCQKHGAPNQKFNKQYDKWVANYAQPPMVALLNLVTTHIPLTTTQPQNSWVSEGSTFYAFPTDRPQDLYDSSDDIIELEGLTPEEQLEDLNRSQPTHPEAPIHKQLNTLKDHLQNEHSINELQIKTNAYNKTVNVDDPNTQNWYLDTTEITKIYIYGNELDTNPAYTDYHEAEKAIVLTQSLAQYGQLRVDDYGTDDFNEKTKGLWRIYTDYKKHLNNK